MTTLDADTAAPKITSDFDWLNGRFTAKIRWLKTPLVGSDEWEDVDAIMVGQTYFNGAISIDELSFPAKGFSGMSIRLFNPETQEWSVYWVSSKRGQLDEPVVGTWVDGVTEIYGDDVVGETPIRVSYRWSDITEHSAHWEQAFSTDGGATWETNWVSDFTRVD